MPLVKMAAFRRRGVSGLPPGRRRLGFPAVLVGIATYLSLSRRGAEYHRL